MYDPRDKYEDIINLPHHVSPTRPPMSNWDRAAQFSPFAALTGHDEAIRECARRTESRIEQAEDAKDALDGKLRILSENIDGWPEVSICYFVPDDKKAGGAYRCLCGRVKKLDEYERLLITLEGEKIRIDDIFSLDGELFECFWDGER